MNWIALALVMGVAMVALVQASRLLNGVAFFMALPIILIVAVTAIGMVAR